MLVPNPVASKQHECREKEEENLPTKTITDDITDSQKTLEQQPLIEALGWKSTELKNNKFAASRESIVSSFLICRICHMECVSPGDPLITPCRCSGTMMYIHRSCLVHWLEISTRKMIPSPRCELCGYNYKRGNFVSLRSIHFPKLRMQDRLLNLLFCLATCIMILCSLLVLNLLPYERRYLKIRDDRSTRLKGHPFTEEDITVLILMGIFLSSMATAVFTQYKVGTTVFRFCFRFYVINRNWTIRNYDLKHDPPALEARILRESIITSQPQTLEVEPLYTTAEIA